MIVKQVTQVGNSVIRRASIPVPQKEIGSKKINAIIKNLIDSMRYHGLVGMAAPQIGVNLRIFVTEIRKTKLRKNQSLKEIDPLRVFINPKIVSFSKQKVSGYEGCGSVAGAQLFGKVSRPKAVTVRAQNAKGEHFELRATGLLARVIQHEYDHINGVVFVDRVTDTKSLMSRNEYLKKFQKK
jgi:peptide deformylase